MPAPPPAELAAQLVRADAALHAHVTVRDALAEQLIELRLSDHPTLSRAVIRLLPSRLARDVTDDVLAHRELTTLKPSHPGPRRSSSDRRSPPRGCARTTARRSDALRSPGRYSPP